MALRQGNIVPTVNVVPATEPVKVMSRFDTYNVDMNMTQNQTANDRLVLPTSNIIDVYASNYRGDQVAVHTSVGTGTATDHSPHSAVTRLSSTESTTCEADRETIDRYNQLCIEIDACEREIYELRNHLKTTDMPMDSYVSKLESLKAEKATLGDITISNGRAYRTKYEIPVLNQLFFRTSVKPNAPVDVEGSYQVTDPDFNKWVYKTWVFTNIDPKDKTIHFTDRTNRPGLVPYKADMGEFLYTTLKIPLNAKGIFVVKDTVCGRPEFTETGLTYPGEVKRLPDVAKQAGYHAGNRVYTQEGHYDTLRYPAKINPVPADKEDPLLKNSLFLHNIENRRDFEERNASGMPYNQDYFSLFNDGLDSAAIDNLRQGRDRVAIDRWHTLVNLHYNNPNFDVCLNPEVDDKNIYSTFVRENYGYLTNYLIRTPITNGEKNLFYLKNRSYIPNVGYGRGYYKLPESYSPGYKFKSQIDTLADLQRQEPVLDKGSNIYELNMVQNNIANYMTRANVISFQDIIFIPYEKLIENHGNYYCDKSDLQFTLIASADMRRMPHPYSKEGLALDRRMYQESVAEPDVIIYEEGAYTRGLKFYTKILGEVVVVPVRQRDANGRSGYIRVKRQTSTGYTYKEYPASEPGIKMLDIYMSQDQAANNGYKESELEKLKTELEFTKTKLQEKELEVKAKEIEAKEKINLIKLKAEEVKYDKTLEDNRHSAVIRKLEFETSKWNDMTSLYNNKLRVELEKAKGTNILTSFEADKILTQMKIRGEENKQRHEERMMEMKSRQASMEFVSDMMYLAKNALSMFK